MGYGGLELWESLEHGAGNNGSYFSERLLCVAPSARRKARVSCSMVSYWEPEGKCFNCVYRSKDGMTGDLKHKSWTRS